MNNISTKTLSDVSELVNEFERASKEYKKAQEISESLQKDINSFKDISIESKLSENYQNLDLFPLKLSLNEKMAKENTAEKSSAMLFQFEGQEQFDKFIDQMKERILARMTNIIKMISNSAFELSKWEGE